MTFNSAGELIVGGLTEEVAVKTLLAVFCAIIAAILFNVAGFLQKKAVDRLPRVCLKPSWTVFKAFVTNKPWMISLAVSLVGGVFYYVAVMLAPISIVQPIVSAGVALLVYLAVRNLGERLRISDFIAIGCTVLGVMMIGVSLSKGISSPRPYDAVRLWVFAGSLFLLAGVIPFLAGGKGTRQGTVLGVSTGLLYGLSAVFSRLLLLDWSNQWKEKGLLVVFSSVFLIVVTVANVLGIIVMQAAFQRGLASIVGPVVGGLNQTVPILAGMLVLMESLPGNPLLSAARIAGFCTILGATVVLSRRAEEISPTKTFQKSEEQEGCQ